ncbi:MAG: FkbM family methyltransferase [Candidatus Paceibacterota bacterium]|jgi:FkbM family methyltransferase
MDEKQRADLKKMVLKRYELYKLQPHRMRRLLKDPIRTIPFYILQSFAYLHPFKVTHKTLWGDTMRFYLPEGSAIYYYGFLEANLTNFLINFLRKGDVFFDVGAHVGYYSILASTLVESSGQVHSFEPTPRTFESLKENASKKSNITVNNNAVLNKETEIEFVDYGPKYSAFNTFKARTSEEMKFLDDANRIKVKAISLDTYCRDKGVSPTFIKIDAEGAEHLILQSMQHILTDIKPLVTLEMGGDEEWAKNCTESIEILKKYGYIGYEIDNDGYLQKHEYKESYRYDNLLFVHPENQKQAELFIKGQPAKE